MNEEEQKWLKIFFSRSDVIYTTYGRKGRVYVGKTDGGRHYTQHLLWNLLDLLDIISGTGKVDATDTFHQNFKKSITICQLYDFVKYHREYSYN